jgi:hypothetical protein
VNLQNLDEGFLGRHSHARFPRRPSRDRDNGAPS